MRRIEKTFLNLKSTNKKAFIVFLTCGYPNLKVTEKLILRLDQIGVDIIELGIPFSDPLADGPTIQEASVIALRNKIDLNRVFRLVNKLRKNISASLCLMSYYNPIFCFGEERLLEKAKSSGVDGIIIPDLPPEEAKDLIGKSKKYGIDIIFFLSPTSTLARIKYIAKISRGFIYYVSLTGVTGARVRLPKDLIKKIKVIKNITDLPVCVGFGISRPEHVKAINHFSDGVIVGSAILKKIKENINRPDLIERVVRFTKSLKNV